MNQAALTPHIPRLRRYARALIRDRYAADDLVQDTLERAINKFHLWRPGSNLRAWLFAIMHNVHVNQLRSRASRPEAQLEDGDLLPHPAVETDRLEIRDMQSAIATLPPEQREVILLIALEQLSYAEVSKALDIPMGTVMSRLFRARERLRVQLSGVPSQSNLKLVR